MKYFAALCHRLSWINLPGALLIALLQRTPVVRVVASAEGVMASSPLGAVLRSAVATVASLGAVHALAGATEFIVRQGSTDIIKVNVLSNTPIRNPATGSVGTTFTPVVFTYTGTPSLPSYYRVTGQLPPGLGFVPAAVNGTIPLGTPGITGTPSQAGTFTIQVQGFGTDGSGQPEPIQFVITGGTPAVAPTFTLQPEGRSVSPGANVTFSAAASGSPAPTFQWRRNGANIIGATNSSLALTNVQTADAGDYSVVITNSAGSLPSAPATLVVATTDANARLTNLSVRAAMAANQTLIVGVVVNDGARDILVRAAGPALTAFGLASAMADPQLELFNGTVMVLSNNDWSSALASTFASVGAFDFQSGSKDAAFMRNILGAYSIQAKGTGPGVVLVEAYDTGALSAARLINVSARNRVGTGDDILIAGFNVSGSGSKQLLIRAVGPTLNSAFGITGVLTDPKLEIYNGAGVKVNENDNWNSSLSATFSSLGAFALASGSRDSALLAILPPGSYTAQVRGADGGTGEALIEIYEVK